jgi:glutathione S-transferase
MSCAFSPKYTSLGLVFKKQHEAVMLVARSKDAPMTITLYGSALSLYTGKPRSYLIKAGLDYRETTPTTKYYNEVVLPQAGQRRGVPVIETTDKQVIRDSTAIIDHYESLGGYQFSPNAPVQRFVSLLLDVIGMEGLLRPAMHYRWDFPEDNSAMLAFHFAMMMPESSDREAMAEKAMNRMRAAGHGFGAVPETFATVERLYEGLLDKLVAHFSLYPYFLGHKPSIGDFGMIAPLYAHLGRDPAPLRLLQSRAIQVFRWVERMNRPELDQGEYAVQGDDYLADDEIPETLIDVLRHIAIDFMPETRSAAELINGWLSHQSDLKVGDTAERTVGVCEFEADGQVFKAIAQPYRFYLLQRVFDHFDSLATQEQQSITELLKRCQMDGLLGLRLSRQIGRENNLEVWLGS